MSDTQQQEQPKLEDFSKEDLIRIVKRGQFVKEQMSQRIIALLSENLELLAIVQELQGDATVVRAQSNGEVPHPGVPADVTS
jgi:hypothetical protein